MRMRWSAIVVVLLAGSGLLRADQFVMFPGPRELRSSDGRFVVRSVDPVTGPSEISGVFHSLVLEGVATGSVRTLYRYVGRVALAWSGSNFVIVSDYLSKRTARALVFPVDPPERSP